MLSRYIYSAIILQHTAFGVFLLVWSIQGIIAMLFFWHSKSHGNFHIRFLVEVPIFPNFVISVFTYRAVFKWLSKNQNQSNYSDQSQQEQTTMNQSQFLSINCNLLKAREKSRVHGAIGLGFASHWLQNWRKSFKPIISIANAATLLLSTVIWKLLYPPWYPVHMQVMQDSLFSRLGYRPIFRAG